MRKLLILSLLLAFSLTFYGQRLPGVIAASGQVSSPCGGGTSNYGITDGSYVDFQTMFENYIYYSSITITTCGTVTSINSLIGTNVSTHSHMALYTDNAGSPGSLVANSTSLAVSQTTNAYNSYTFSINPSVQSSTTYWVAWLSTGGNFNSYIANSGSKTVMYEAGSSFPATATGISIATNCYAPFYVTVQH